MLGTRVAGVLVVGFIAGVSGSLSFSPAAHAQAGVTTTSGTLTDGATYLIQVPAAWNGTLLLYSHGYVTPGSANPARVGADPGTTGVLLQQGFALAGSSYATTGWAIHEALQDQITLLDVFESIAGHKARTIAWGHSLGGIISAGLMQRNPERFAAALPMCGVLGGGVGTWNQGLDSAVAFKILLGAGTALEVVHISDPEANVALAEGLFFEAQLTPEGRARIALITALADIPGWFTPTSPEPAADDVTTQEGNQFLWGQQVGIPFTFEFRAELEARAGGNPSWNVGTNYRKQLERSVARDEVRALYHAAGLSLEADLEALNQSPRIAADPGAFEYLEQNITFDGEIRAPVLTAHTKGDGFVVVENETSYKRVVHQAGNGHLLRQTFVERAGHCTFTPAETLALFQKLVERLDTGRWPDLGPADLNAAATALGPALNVFFTNQGVVVSTPPAFTDLRPGPFLRPFTERSDDDSAEKPECGRR
jgi:pimeloyl-ACP methyl ester carboxylesterase